MDRIPYDGDIHMDVGRTDRNVDVPWSVLLSLGFGVQQGGLQTFSLQATLFELGNGDGVNEQNPSLVSGGWE